MKIQEVQGRKPPARVSATQSSFIGASPISEAANSAGVSGRQPLSTIAIVLFPFLAGGLFYGVRFLPNLDPNWRVQVAQAKSYLGQQQRSDSLGAYGGAEDPEPAHHPIAADDEPKPRRFSLDVPQMNGPATNIARQPSADLAEYKAVVRTNAQEAPNLAPPQPAYATAAVDSSLASSTQPAYPSASDAPAQERNGDQSPIAYSPFTPQSSTPTQTPTFSPISAGSLAGRLERTTHYEATEGVSRPESTLIGAPAANTALTDAITSSSAARTGIKLTRDPQISLITNGSFEMHTSTTSYTGWTFGTTTYPAPVAGIVSNYSGGSPLKNTNFGQPAGGTVSVDLSNDSGQIFLGQAVSLVKGKVYTLAFDVDAYYFNTNSTKFSVFFTSVLPASGSYVDVTSLSSSVGFTNMTYLVPSSTNPSPVGGMPTTWTTESEFFTSTTSGVYYLTFALSGGIMSSGGSDAAFDRVALTTTADAPEPAPAVLCFFGCALLLPFRRTRQTG